MKKAMRCYGLLDKIATDKLRWYSAVTNKVGCSVKQVTIRWANNRFENWELPFCLRETAVLMFSCIHSPQKFASIQASIDKLINSQTLLSGRSIFKLNRDAARTEWCLSLTFCTRGSTNQHWCLGSFVWKHRHYHMAIDKLTDFIRMPPS